jgi:predicted Zn-dependent protease
MNKIILQGLVGVVLFFAAWFVLQQIDWVNIFKVQQTKDKTEEKLGDLFWDIFKNAEQENDSPFVMNALDSLVSKICEANNIDRELIKIHIIEKDEINAFALPNGHLVVYTGLISNAENQEELSGVLCHEIGHIMLSHVMKKLVQEVGLSVLISMTGGSGGADVIKETAKMISSSAFDRSLEKEADIKAVDYLINASLDPEPFANFLYKLGTMKGETSKYIEWMSTHPESKERAAYILEYSKGKEVKYESILCAETWEELKEKLEK